MTIYSIGKNPLSLGYNIFKCDFGSEYASIGTLTGGTCFINQNYTLTIPVFNSGFSNSYYVVVSASDHSEFAVTGATQTISNGGSYTWSATDQFTSSGTTTITVKLYSGSSLIDTKTYNQYIDSAPRNITGGAITTSGSYTIHTFTGNTNFVVTTLGDVTYFDILMVAGGGGGGWSNGGVGGGGGAGGLLSGRTTSLSTGTFSIVIGGGGSNGVASPPRYGQGYSGGNTTFSGFTAYGGGGGGRGADSGGDSGRGLNGGSGGGSGNNNNTSGSATQNSQSPLTGYGNNGGNVYQSGGGGAGSSDGTSGGDGKVCNFSGSDVTYSIGGNGGGISGTNSTYGSGGRGGGWDGATSGIQGVVIIRYLT